MRILALLLALSAAADDSAYEAVRDNIFWPVLYNRPYVSLYCGTVMQPGQRLTVEHVYAASWMAAANGCPNRDSCPLDTYRAASSDMHNLWPALRRYNSSRGNQRFGEIPGEAMRFPADGCDFERESGADALVEPRDVVKGSITRSMLYMITRYGLPDQGLSELMLRWNQAAPPGETEIARNHQIKGLQGNSNPFIDMWD